MRTLPRFFSSLRARIFLALLLIGSLAGLAVGGASYYIARSMVKRHVTENLTSVANDVTRLVEEVWIPTLEREMLLLADVAGRFFADEPGTALLKRTLQEGQIKVPGFKRLNVFLPGGIYLAGSDPAYGGRLEEKIVGIRPGETVITPFRRLDAGGESEVVMTVAAPVVREGKVYFVLAGDLTPDGIGRDLGSLSVGVSGEIYLVDPDGRLITMPPRAPEGGKLEVLGEPLETEGVAKVVQGESGVSEYVNYAGRRVVGAFRHVPRTGWGVLVEEDAAEAFADLPRLRNFIIYIVLGLAMASLLVSLVLAQRITVPLRRLQTAAEKLGLGDLEYRVEVRGGGELRGLAASFNRMAEALQSSQELLEDRVRERTAELRTINEMIASLVRSRSPAEILQNALRVIMEFTGYESGWCYLASEKDFNLLYRRCQTGVASGLPESFRVGEGLLGSIAGEARAVIWEDIERSAPPEWREVFPSGSAVFLPLKSTKRFLGFLCAHSAAVCNLSADAGRTLEAMADEVAIALENALLYQELQAHVEELEQANRELRTLDEMKSNFISAISHELKQPLSLISGYAQTIRDYYETLTYEEEMRCLQIIVERTDFLSSLVDDLLDLSQLETGRLRLHKEECDLAEITRRVVSEYAMKSPTQPFVVDFPDGFPAVVADARRLEQVLSNLLSNAVKFSEGKGEIRVEGRVKDDRAQVRVMDRGIGIEPSQLRRIFDRFYQADISTRRAYSGVGLGLFISRELVEAHGGRIWAENRPGGGAVITFELPLSSQADGD